MSSPTYSLVVATLDRPNFLAGTLQSVARQTLPPSQVIIVDASSGDASSQVADQYKTKFDCLHLRAERRSAALQRNQGAQRVLTPLIVFADDDIILRPDTLEKLVSVFARDPDSKIGGVAARIEGLAHPRPRGLLWWYYRLQAGYSHPDYGARLFGPAINCLPSYQDAEQLIEADWLNSGCAAYRTPLFMKEQFPDFDGYSFMEDVHLSARISAMHKLYFHRDAIYQHLDAGSDFKRDVAQLARRRMRNQRRVAREILGLDGWKLEIKLFLHRLLVTASLLRSWKPGNDRHIRGLWT